MMIVRRKFRIVRTPKTLFLLLILNLDLNAAVYKCIERDGRVTYQQQPCVELEKQSDAQDLNTINTQFSPIHRSGSTADKSQFNLVQNPAFESQLEHWQYNTAVHWLPGVGFQGSAALMIQADKPPDDDYIHETIASQCVLLDQKSRYRLSVYFRHKGGAAKPHANRLNIIWYESADCTSGGQFGDYLEPKNISNWQYLEKINLKPSLGAIAAKIELVQNGRYSNYGSAYWDEIELSATVAKPETKTVPLELDTQTDSINKDYIVNGDFKQDLTGWRTGWKTAWVLYVGDASPGAVHVISTSLRSSIGKSALNQCVNLGVAKDFILGASFKKDETSTQEGGGRLRLSWYELEDCKGNYKTGRSIDPKSSRGWQRLRLDSLSAPHEARSANITVIQSVKGQGRFSAYWDDIFFRSVPAR